MNAERFERIILQRSTVEEAQNRLRLEATSF